MTYELLQHILGVKIEMRVKAILQSASAFSQASLLQGGEETRESRQALSALSRNPQRTSSLPLQMSKMRLLMKGSAV